MRAAAGPIEFATALRRSLAPSDTASPLEEKTSEGAQGTARRLLVTRSPVVQGMQPISAEQMRIAGRCPGSAIPKSKRDLLSFDRVISE